MKDPTIAYKERLENIHNLIKDGQYGNCFKIAKNLTNFSWTMELKEEVFISEILEAIFIEMSDVMMEHKIPNNIKDELKTTLIERMKELINAYNTKNATALYEALKEIRYEATHYQLNAWQKYPEKDPSKYGGIE